MSINAVDTQSMTGSFRNAAGQFASGVTIVSTRNGEHVYGITATSFVSLSLNPLLVTVSINSHSPILTEIRQSGIFAISVLSSEQEAVSKYFSTRGRGKSKDRFEGIHTVTEVTGAPVIGAALSWFDCRLHSTLAGGDHEILVGEVASAGGTDGKPLLYWSGGYRQLETPQEAEGEAAGRQRIEDFADAISVQLHMQGMVPEELVEAQQALEPQAAALAARRRTSGDVAELQALIDAAAKVEHDQDWFTAKAADFHSAVGQLSGNAAIAASVRALSNPRRALYATGTSLATATRTTAAHQAILDAIAAGHSEQARELMTKHLATVAKGIC